MTSRIKTRTGKYRDDDTRSRPREAWRIVIPNVERNGEPLKFSADDYSEMMRAREMERRSKRITFTDSKGGGMSRHLPIRRRRQNKGAWNGYLRPHIAIEVPF